VNPVRIRDGPAAVILLLFSAARMGERVQHFVPLPCRREGSLKAKESQKTCLEER